MGSPRPRPQYHGQNHRRTGRILFHLANNTSYKPPRTKRGQKPMFPSNCFRASLLNFLDRSRAKHLLCRFRCQVRLISIPFSFVSNSLVWNRIPKRAALKIYPPIVGINIILCIKKGTSPVWAMPFRYFYKYIIQRFMYYIQLHRLKFFQLFS